MAPSTPIVILFLHPSSLHATYASSHIYLRTLIRVLSVSRPLYQVPPILAVTPAPVSLPATRCAQTVTPAARAAASCLPARRRWVREGHFVLYAVLTSYFTIVCESPSLVCSRHIHSHWPCPVLCFALCSSAHALFGCQVTKTVFLIPQDDRFARSLPVFCFFYASDHDTPFYGRSCVCWHLMVGVSRSGFGVRYCRDV